MADWHINCIRAARHFEVPLLTLTREQELWGMALWVEKHHGDVGDEFISSKIDHLRAVGEKDGAKLWQDVALRYQQLHKRAPHS